MDKGRPIKLLVVDDEVEIAHALSIYGRKKGYDVLVANDGLSAKRAGEEFRPDVVLLDISLPGMDGRDVLAHWNEQGVMNDAVVIFVTARDEQSDRVVGLELGAADYETKPLHFQLLFSKIERLLEKKAGGAPAA